MKLKIQKQTALKGLLFLALAGNISFHPGVQATIQALDMSSETMSGAPAAAAPQRADMPAPKPPSNAVTTSDTGLRPDPPARAGQNSETKDETLPEKLAEPSAPRSEIPQICGRRFYVTFREIVFKDSKMTEIRVKPHTGVTSDFQSITYRKNGSFSDNLDNSDVKKDLDKELAAAVEKKLGRCPKAKDDPIGKDDKDDRKEAKEDRERIREGMKNCRVDSKGDPLSESDVVRCRLSSLDRIDLDGDSRSSQTKAMGQVERIIRGDIRKSIKNRLMSNDSSKIEEGEQLLAETQERLEDISVDLNLDPSRFARMKMELETLKTAGETYRRGVDMGHDVKTARDEAREQLRLAKSEADKNPQDVYAQQRLLEVQSEILKTQSQLSNLAQMEVANQYRQLQQAQQQGLLSSSEFGQFTMPYQTMRQDLMSMLDTRGILNPNTNLGQTNYSLPTDFMGYRQGLAQNFQNSYGVNVPQRTNSIVAPMNPMVNSLNQNGSMFQNYDAPTQLNLNNGRRF